MTSASTRDSRSFGKASAPSIQAEAPAFERPFGLRLRTLIWLRWAALAGQSLALLTVWMALGLHLPIVSCLVVLALSVLLNVGFSISSRTDRLTTPTEAALQLAFDILQLTALLFLTGGVVNPFCLLLVAPVTLAAATLPPRHALALGLLTVICAVALAFFFLPVPWRPGETYSQPLAFRLVSSTAIVTGVLFSAGYAWRASRESARMQLALNVTQSVLAREQRLSALGGLAAAAAHELGTPLATIQVVAKEMARDAPENLKEDARLLITQTQRCREILQRLTQTPDTADEMHGRMSLTQMLNEIIEPHAEAKVRVEALVSGAKDGKAPDVRRMPEVLHAMTSFVDNAIDFARSEVLVTARYDAETIAVEVRDDGPGFAPEVLVRLGQPYVTSRSAGEPTRSGHTGMGLGFFIAKTLLERTGAVVEFRNGKPGGAVVSARWKRHAIETPTVG
jgi:two-component system, sensor histidine kinase RegB